MRAGSWVVARIGDLAVVESLRAARPRRGRRSGPARPSARRGPAAPGRRPSPGRGRRAAARRPTARPGARSAWSASPNRGERGAAPGRARPGPSWPRMASPSSTFSRADRNGTRSRTWSTRPIVGRPEPGQAVAVERREVRAQGRDPALGRAVEAGDQAQERRLARAGRPGHDVEAAAPEGGGRRRQAERPAVALAVATGRALEDDRIAAPSDARTAAGSGVGGRGQRRAPASPASSVTRPGSALGGPTRSATARPSATWTTRSAIALDELVVGDDRGRSCPRPGRRSRRTPRISSAVAPSSSPVGSSARSRAGPRGQGHGEGDALLLAAGQLVAVGAAPVRQPDPVRGARSTRWPALGLGHAPQGERQVDRVGRAQVRRERPSVVLLDDADALASMAVEVAARLASVRSRPRTSSRPADGRSRPATQAQQGRLARTGRADDGRDLAGLDGQVEAAQGGDRAATRRVDADEAAGDGWRQPSSRSELRDATAGSRRARSLRRSPSVARP